MLKSAMNGVRYEKAGVLRSKRGIYGQMSAVLNWGRDNDENGFFAHLHKNEKKILFNYTKRAKELH
jgi:hypothetical protein